MSKTSIRFMLDFFSFAIVVDLKINIIKLLSGFVCYVFNISPTMKEKQ